MEAEKLLMSSQNTIGSFLVCHSEETSEHFILLIRDEEGVQHYYISLNDGRFSITSQDHFPSIPDLVNHYSQHPDGLCLPPMHPCQMSGTDSLSKQAIQEWIINKHQIRLLRKVGVGWLGEVWEGVWNRTTLVAVKILKSGTTSTERFLQEVGAIAKFRHTNLVQLYAVCTKEKPIYIITEFVKHGSLLEYLRREGRSLKLPQLIGLCTQIACGMAYLEQHSYVHCNLAARNVLMGENLTCKVADYALNEYLYKKCAENVFPIRWTAPEAAQYSRFTVKSDVWSFGIVLYEIITQGKNPYIGMTNKEVLEKVLEGYRMPQPMGCPDKVYDIMQYCWRTEPDDRYTFDTLKWILDEFFENDLDLLYTKT